MRRVVFLAFMAAARLAAASGAPTIDAKDVAFGLVTNGSSAVRYINVLNVDTPPRATLTVTSAQLMNNAAGWFSFATPDCPGSQDICTFSPAFSIVDTGAVVAVRCAPVAGSIGTQIATVVFASNSVSATFATATLTCTAGAGVLDVLPASHVVEFGAVDLDRTPVSVATSVRLHNIGNENIVTGAAVPSGPDVARYGFSSLLGHTLAPGASYDIIVTYTPIVERAATDPDSAELAISITGALGITTLQIDLRGHGADRHAVLGVVPAVPDTFTNPGPAAALVPITIANTGEAVLGLSNPVVTGGAAWSVANPDPVDVPGGASFAYLVRFAPSSAGAAPAAMFSVETNDDAAPLLTASLSGSGRDRPVTMGPDTIELYFAGVDTTARLSDGTRGQLLQLTNNSPDHDFEIRGIPVVGGEDAFVVTDTTGVIAARQTRTFDVEFKPPHAGTFEATAYLFLDSDPTPQASVVVRGEGVFVDVAGGGGCSSGGGTDVGMVIVVALFALANRRRWLALLAWGGIAHADTRNLDLAQFDPVPATTNAAFQLQSADVGREGDWVATALASYANDPLVLVTAPNDNVAVSDRTTLALGGAIALGERFELALHMPLYIQSGENLNSPTMYGEAPASGTARGDLALNAKARLWRRHGPRGAFIAGVAVGLQFPTASDEQFAGSGKPQVRALALVSFTVSHAVDLAANVGPVLRATADFHDVHQGSGLAWALGAAYHATDKLALAAELFGEIVPSGLRDAMGTSRTLDTVEALGGLHYQLDRRVNVGLAIGRGVTSGIGAPAVRGVLTVTFAPKPPPSIGSRYVGGDSDGDGIPDDIDQCPDQAEDKDGWQDEDGCPDPDNDHDGIPDASDKCPNEPEDKDGFQDEDGCPDPDNDLDGIPDRFDHCPNQPETINGIEDEDGCPDVGEGLVEVAADHVRLKEAIEFTAAGKLAPASFNILGQLGATLRAHPELVKVRVVAHTPSTHARAVLDWLLQYGITSGRLEAAVAPDATDATPERIEIVVVDRY